jgi:hypothetical protein
MTAIPLHHDVDHPEASVTELQRLIGLIASERQRLRDEHADGETLERNRLELVEAHLDLSHALIALHFPHAA